MAIFLPAQTPAIDGNGVPLAGAVWEFYHGNSRTPAATDRGETVSADVDGVFPDITLDADFTYRAVLSDIGGKMIRDIGAVAESLFAPSAKPATDDNVVQAGAVWKFYTTATTTPQTVYSDDDLATPLGWRVEADADGNFPAIYLDDGVAYRAVLEAVGGAQLGVIDPVTFDNMWLYLNPSAAIPPAELLPSAGYTGTAGSGFGGGFGAVPTDPTRTTAKPAMRMLTPTNQYFTDTIVVGVFAAANNAGSMLSNLGLQKVVCHYEGVARDIASPTVYSFNDVNGVARSYLGWWVTLKKPTGITGHARVYFEAVPLDPAMQRRVIGPCQFSPQAAVNDIALAITPSLAAVTGVRYQTILAAMDYCRTQSKQSPLITITEAGLYDVGNMSFTYQPNSYFTIQASVPVTIGKASYTTDAAMAFRPAWDGVHLRGSNITLNLTQSTGFYHEAGDEFTTTTPVRHWFDGITILDSAPDALIRKAAKPNIYTARNYPWFTECTINGARNGGVRAMLHRGTAMANGTGDAMSDSACIVGGSVSNWDSAPARTNINAMTVQYTGGGATATLSLAGGNSASSRVMTAKVGGSTVGTKTLLASEAAFIASTDYEVSDVVTWLNTLSGWSATLLDDTRQAVCLGAPGLPGSWTDVNVKTAAVTFYTWIDDHCDVYQSYVNSENVICAGLTTFGNDTQNIFLYETNHRDMLFLNCAMDNQTGGVLQSQLGGTHSHVVVAHCSFGQQTLSLRTDGAGAYKYNPDAYCLVANNAGPALVWSSTPDTDLTIKGNHLFTGASTPSGSTGTTIGGTKATLFADAGAGNFTPAGALLTNLKTPVVSRDMAGTVRGTTDAAGVKAI